eukprot:scaffold6301_cov165-Amphora_coffeaeformis.AAC.15
MATKELGRRSAHVEMVQIIYTNPELCLLPAAKQQQRKQPRHKTTTRRNNQNGMNDYYYRNDYSNILFTFIHRVVS